MVRAQAMRKSVFRRALNRFLALAARVFPGAEGLRPFLHRLRGVKIMGRAFIGDDVMIETEYPECVEIHDHVSISMRATIVAHTRGTGKVILEKDCFVGPHAIIICPVNRTLKVGEGAVIGAGSVITRSVPARQFIAPPPSRSIATLQVPFTEDVSMEEFLAGMKLHK
jgi:acetyltransferase-like isoleucine patch superfamily enzyme